MSATTLYLEALTIVAKLVDLDPERDTDEGVLLDALTDAIVKYETHKGWQGEHVRKRLKDHG
jgi:antitoxin component HigA of HigAB toxin-antitoxin module